MTPHNRNAIVSMFFSAHIYVFPSIVAPRSVAWYPKYEILFGSANKIPLFLRFPFGSCLKIGRLAPEMGNSFFYVFPSAVASKSVAWHPKWEILFWQSTQNSLLCRVKWCFSFFCLVCENPKVPKPVYLVSRVSI